LAVEVVGGVIGFVAGFFLRGEGGVEFAGGDLFGGGVGEAEFAGGEVVLFGTHGWAEGSAEDGAGFVEVAGAGGGVEDGAGFVVAYAVFGFVSEEFGVFVVGVEDAGLWVSRESWGEASARGCCSLLDAVGFFGIGLVEGLKAFAEAGCVLLGDGEDADAALGTAGMADEVVASAVVGVGHGGVDDLDELVCHYLS
jgi:hypothetical protein